MCRTVASTNGRCSRNRARATGKNELVRGLMVPTISLPLSPFAASCPCAIACVAAASTRRRLIKNVASFCVLGRESRVVRSAQGQSGPIQVATGFCQCRKEPVAEQRTDRHWGITLLRDLQN